MVYLQLVFPMVLLATHSVLSETFEEIQAACNKETGFTGDLQKINVSDPAFPKEAKCSLACTFDKQGAFKPDGSIDITQEKAMPEEILKNEEFKNMYMTAVEKCDASAKANKCETAYEFVKCVNTKVASM